MATSNSSKADFNSYMGQLDKTLDLYLRQKLPALPKNAKEAVVKFMPWIVLILMILALPLILGLLGLSFILSPLMGISGGGRNILSILVLAVALIFEVMSISELMKRSSKGWMYAYYSALLSGVSSLLSFDLVSAIIGTGISLYILYQVKEYYK